MKRIVNKKKIKNIFVTLIEIIVISAIIMGTLMTIQDKLDKNSSGTGKQTSDKGSSVSNKENIIEEYYLEVNVKKNTVIVYQYNKDKSNKKPIKVMIASIGSDIKEGKFKIAESYTWLNTTEKRWNKYNTKYANKCWFQSLDFYDKYSWKLDKDSYNKLGKSQGAGGCIKLLAKDAEWIFSNCKIGTPIKIVKGNKKDKLPLSVDTIPKTYKYCGWEPTDPDKKNPYKSAKPSSMVAYKGTVFIEKGADVSYLANLIALDEKGKNVLEKVTYKEFDSSQMGEHKVKYTYAPKNEKKKEITVKYKVIDTTVPIARTSATTYTYEVVSANEKDYKKKEVKEAIERLVKSHASASEGTITVTALPKEQLVIGDNPVRVVATDASGNIGSTEVTVVIKVKNKALNKKYKPKKKVLEEAKKTAKNKKNKVEETTKKTSKVEKETTKKSSKKEKETTKKSAEKTTTKKVDEATKASGNKDAGNETEKSKDE